MKKMLDFYRNTVLTNFEPLGLQKDAPHRASMGILAFNLLQITGLMGLGLLTIFHFHYPPFQKWLKIRKILNFHHNRCSVKLQFWSSLSPNRTKEMHLIGHLWASQPSPCHRLLEYLGSSSSKFLVAWISSSKNAQIVKNTQFRSQSQIRPTLSLYGN